MRVANILFNYKKSNNENKILGVERCFIDYSKHLVAHQNQVVSISKPGMVFNDEIKKVGSKLVELPAFSNIDLFSIIVLGLVFVSFRVEVAVCHSGRALLFSRVARIIFYPFLRKLKIVTVNHGIKARKFLKSDYVFNINTYFHRQMINLGMKEYQSIIFPNMIDIPKDFTKLEKPAFRKPIRLGSLGRIYFEKYFDKVVVAIALLKQKGIECEYVIGGVGPKEQEIKELAKQLGVEKNVTILGWVDNKREFFSNIDIFLLPSFGETFGIVLLEAMLYSTPIITSNSWGPEDIISQEVDGIKVSKDDADEMPKLIAQAIERLNDDQDFAKKLAEKAYEKFNANYSSDVVGKRLNDTLFQIINNQIS